MSHISPVRAELTQVEFSAIGGQLQVSPVNEQLVSSLCSASSKNKGVLAWISNLLGKIWSTIKSFLSKLGCFRNENEIDWAETKQIFTGIRQAVFSGNDPKICKARFKTHYEELSKPAQELFQRHIGYAIARQNRAITRAEQEQYVGDYWTEISKGLKDTMDDISRDEIREAVESFGHELDKH